MNFLIVMAIIVVGAYLAVWLLTETGEIENQWIIEPNTCTVFSETMNETMMSPLALEIAAHLQDEWYDEREFYNELDDIDYDDDIVPLDSITPPDNEIFE